MSFPGVQAHFAAVRIPWPRPRNPSGMPSVRPWPRRLLIPEDDMPPPLAYWRERVLRATQALLARPGFQVTAFPVPEAALLNLSVPEARELIATVRSVLG